MKTGKIQLIMGPMFSGKTTELIKRISRESMYRHKKTILIKYAKDQRYGIENVLTHDKVYNYSALKAERIEEVYSKLKDYDIIAIDEGQFFEDLEKCDDLANEGKMIMISALSGNFKRELFKPISKILPKCESIIQLKAFCGICKEEDADYSLRTIKSEQEIYIGGADVYKPVCRKCYFNPTAFEKKVDIGNEIRHDSKEVKEKLYKV